MTPVTASLSPQRFAPCGLFHLGYQNPSGTGNRTPARHNARMNTTPSWSAVTTVPDGLSESPFWHPDEQLLYWVDIAGKKIHRSNVFMGTVESWAMAAPHDLEPGCIAPARSGGLVIARGSSGLPRPSVTEPTCTMISSSSPLSRGQSASMSASVGRWVVMGARAG